MQVATQRRLVSESNKKASLTRAEWKFCEAWHVEKVKIVESKDRRSVAVKRNLWKNSLIQ